MITLAWGGMWENTPGAAPFPCESFPSELAITQQLAGVRERLFVIHREPGGFPCVWQGCVTSGATSTTLSLCALGKQCMGVPLLCATTQAEHEGQPHTGTERFILYFTLIWSCGLCSDPGAVGLHLQQVHHLYQQRPWEFWAPVTNLHRVQHGCLTNRYVRPSDSGSD